MGAIEHLTISLPADMLARLRDRVRAGDFADESAAIRDALAEMEAYNGQHEQWLRSEVIDIYDRMKRDPSRAIPLQDVVASVKADRRARGE